MVAGPARKGRPAWPGPSGSPAAWAGVARMLLGTALLIWLYLNVALSGQVGPVTATVSDYVLYGRGALLLPLSVLLLVLAGLAVGAGLVEVGAPLGRLVRALFWAWVLGLLLTVVFPPDPAGADLSFSGRMHRLGAAVLFTALPAAGLRLAGELRADPRWRNQAPRVRRWSVAAGLTAVAFAICQLPRLMPWLPGADLLVGVNAQGLSERCAVLAEAGLLLALTRALRRFDRDCIPARRHGRAA